MKNLAAALALAACALFAQPALADPNPCLNQVLVQQQLQQQLQSSIGAQAQANQLQQMQSTAQIQTQLQQSAANIQVLLLQQQLLQLNNAYGRAVRSAAHRRRGDSPARPKN